MSTVGVVICGHGEKYDQGRRDGKLYYPPQPKTPDTEQPCSICGLTNVTAYNLGLSDASIEKRKL